jgi:hypothetical protein
MAKDFAWGDFNGDGYADMALLTDSRPRSVLLWQGSSAPGTQFNGEIDVTAGVAAIRRASDLDNDGFDDLLLLSKDNSILGYPGRSTPASTTQWSLTGYGVSPVIGAGADVDHDGKADFVVTKPHGAPDSGAPLGRVFVFLGVDLPPTNPAAELGGVSDANFGTFLTISQDYDGDGYADMTVGDVNYAGTSGTIYFYPGGNPLPTPFYVPRVPGLSGTYLGSQFD